MRRFFSIKRAVPLIVLVMAIVLYIFTLAPSVVPGDPGEYQFIPHILGIAHPPGYAFFTLLAKVWTSVVRVGSIAYRSNLLAAFAGAWTVLITFEMAMLLGEPRAGWLRDAQAGEADRPGPSPRSRVLIPVNLRVMASLFAALALATSTDLWQHSIHANPHIVSAALSMSTLYTGLRWWATGRDRWLYSFSFLAALGVTHHPLLAVGAPAYVVFVFIARPRIITDPRRLGGIVLSVLLGLSVFLYLPLRAGATPFGPTPSMDAIIGHAAARGIRGNLFHFGLADQTVRSRVFLELLQLQFAPLTLILSIAGLVWLAWRRPRPLVLLSLFYGLNLAFTINTVQDVMAYLLLPFATTAVLAGAGVLVLLDGGIRILQYARWKSLVFNCVIFLLIVGPLTSAVHKAPRLSLRDYRSADNYIQAVFDEFEGKRKGAVLLAPWEGMTPLQYAEHVEGRRLVQADVEVVFVAAGTANPWVDFVWKHIEDGPIYLADYRPEVAAAGFRLRPVGDWPLYKLEPPPATQEAGIGHPVGLWAGDTIHLLGWDLDRTTLRAGETAYLTLYMSTSRELTDFYMPYLWLGDRLYRWTTDSRLNTPWWKPEEIIVERYEVTVPFGTPPGDYPLSLGISNVSQGQDLSYSNGKTTIKLALPLHVDPATIVPPESIWKAALANLNSRIILTSGRASARGQTVEAPWDEPLRVQPGDSIQVWLDWRALTSVDQPYTVFVHFVDGAGGLWAQKDYTPMGGAFPTFLWIPRWIEGQRVSDPYKLTLHPNTPPGDYWIEIGMYGMTSLRRVYHFDPAGNLAGDRYLMGPVRVEEP